VVAADRLSMGGAARARGMNASMTPISSRRSGQKQRRPCVFCGRTVPLTKEHVWPQQLGDVLPNVGPGKHLFGLTGDPESWVLGDRPAFSRAVKIVCAQCNNVWMSRLEMAARPIFEPMMPGTRRVTVQPSEQRTLAFWIVKTAMTLQLSHPTRQPEAIPSAHYSELYKEQRPPRLCQVWIAGCTHDDRPIDLPMPMIGRCRITPLKHFRPDDIPVDQPKLPAYSVAMSMGNLAMAIFGHQFPSRTRRRPRAARPETVSHLLDAPARGRRRV